MRRVLVSPIFLVGGLVLGSAGGCGESLNSCGQNNGFICAKSLECPGEWLKAEETERCCSTPCESPVDAQAQPDSQTHDAMPDQKTDGAKPGDQRIEQPADQNIKMADQKVDTKKQDDSQ